MPKYIVTSPDGRDFEVTAPDGASQDEVLAYAQQNFSVSGQTTKARSLGLGARGVVEGLASFPLMVGDAANAVVNYGVRGINSIAGTDIPQLGSASSAFGSIIDESGLPVPQSDAEKMVVAANRGGASVLTPAGLAKGAGAVAEPLTRNMGAQLLSGLAGGGASELAKQKGAGTAGQVAAGLAGGIAAPTTTYAAYKAVSSPAKAVAGVASGFTRSGQERAVGRTLNQIATDRVRAQSNMSDAREIVPGSAPTAGQASRDYGIISLERAMKSKNPELFALRYSQQNAARNRLIDSIAKSDSEINAAKEARDAIATTLRESAFSNASQARTNAIIDKIDSVLASPQGKRKSVEQAMKTIRSQIDGETNPQALYEIRKDIGQMLGGKYSGDAANLKLASSELMDVRNVIDDVIEEAAPGFKGYLEKYKELSRPISQMERATEMRARSEFAAPDITGEPIITQARWKRALASVESDKLNPFNKKQMRQLNKIADDLDRGALMNNAAIRPPGSDTAQNVNVANLVGMTMGGGGVMGNLQMAAVMRPIQWMMQTSSENMDRLMAEALLDPKAAAMLMQKATPSSARKFSERLLDLGTAASIGSAESTSGQQVLGR